MKYIDRLVKKLISESLDLKADEITEKINQKLSGHMGEGECMEGDCGEMKEIGFKQGLSNAARKKFGKTPKSLEDKFRLSDFEDDDDMTDTMSGEFDYVAEGECMEGDCGEMEESTFGDGLGYMDRARRNIMGQLLDKEIKNNERFKEAGLKTYDDGEQHLRSELGIEDEDVEMKEGNAFLKKLKDTPKGGKFKLGGKNFTDTSDYDGEMEEGNAFSGALAKAKEKGDDTFKVGGKKFDVKSESKIYSINFTGGVLNLTEEELVSMIEELVLEEKGKSKGMVQYDKVHNEDKKINNKANQESFKKMKDYVKVGSKSSFETNPKQFPKGNGELAKMDKKAYTPSDAVDEYVSDFAYPGMTNLTFDEIKPDDEKIKKYLKGDKTTGNSSEYANAVETEVGEKFYKNYENNEFGAEQKKASYKRQSQPVDIAGENKSGVKSYKKSKGQKALDKLSENNEKQNILSEEMTRIKQMIGYNKKSQ